MKAYPIPGSFFSDLRNFMLNPPLIYRVGHNEADKVTWMEKTSWRDKKRETRLGFSLAVRTGLEPVTPCVTGMYSNQLN